MVLSTYGMGYGEVVAMVKMKLDKSKKTLIFFDFAFVTVFLTVWAFTFQQRNLWFCGK